MPNNKAPDGRRSRPFKVICISIYKDDLDAMDKLVTSLKACGLTTMNRSWLIREAVAGVDVAKIAEQIVNNATKIAEQIVNSSAETEKALDVADVSS